jgi:NAD(P)-dependent dehydrogenase (short-subunit alcohol dehydrogenase family)
MDDSDRVMAINTKGMVLVSNAVVKVMLKQEPRTFTTLHGISRELSRGVFVNVTSAMSYGVIPGKIAYATSKHAALSVTKTFGKTFSITSLYILSCRSNNRLAVDLGSKGI